MKSGLIYTTRSSSITSFLPGQSIEKRKAEAKGKAKCKAKSKGKKKSVKEEEPKQVESHFAALLDKDYGDEDADDEDVEDPQWTMMTLKTTQNRKAVVGTVSLFVALKCALSGLVWQ